MTRGWSNDHADNSQLSSRSAGDAVGIEPTDGAAVGRRCRYQSDFAEIVTVETDARREYIAVSALSRPCWPAAALVALEPRVFQRPAHVMFPEGVSSD